MISVCFLCEEAGEVKLKTSKKLIRFWDSSDVFLQFSCWDFDRLDPSAKMYGAGCLVKVAAIVF